MPNHAHRPLEEEQVTSGPSQDTPEQGGSTPDSNAEAQQQLRGPDGTPEGLASYEEALGQWLGGELYKVIAPHLTFGAIQGYANDGFEQAIKGAIGSLGSLDGEIDKKALERFAEALVKQYGSLAGKVLDTKAGHKVTGAVAGWVDANPDLIVLTALLAAATAILMDMDVPTIKTKFGIIDGLNADLEAKLGSLQQLAFHEIKAKLSYVSGPLVAAMAFEHDKEAETQGYSAEVGLAQSGSYAFKSDIQFTQDGFKAYGFSGMFQGGFGRLDSRLQHTGSGAPDLSGSLTTSTGQVRTVRSLKYDGGAGSVAFQQVDVADLFGGSQLKRDQRAATDGTSSTALSLTQPVGPHTKITGGVSESRASAEDGGEASHRVDAGVDHNQGAFRAQFRAAMLSDDPSTFSATGTYKPNDRFTTTLGGQVSTAGAGHVQGSATYKPNHAWTLQGQGRYDFGEAPHGSLSGAAKFDDGRNRFEAGGGFKSQDGSHHASLMGQHRFSESVVARGEAGYRHGPQGTEWSAGAHGGYFFNKDVGLIGGTRFQHDAQGRSHWIPEVGAQIRGVPLTVGYNTQTNKWVIGARFKF